MTAQHNASATRNNALPWLVIFCGCTIALLTFGPRSAMGLFQIPLLEARGWDRTTFSLAFAIQNIVWGLGQPVFGAISDRYGTWRVLTLSALFYIAGLCIMSIADTPLLLNLSAGVLVGLGIAGGSFTIVMAAFARNVPAERRVFVFGLGTAAGSAGMAVFSPLAVELISLYGWQSTLIIMASMLTIIPFLAIPLAGNSGNSKIAAREAEQGFAEAFREAMGHRSYQLLVAGFFVCGFQLAFVTAHFPAYLAEINIDPYWAGFGLMLIGLCNVAGSLGSGYLSQHFHMPHLLGLIYIARAVAVAGFMLLPPSPATVVIFCVITGLLWLSTVPPTNALVAVMFGTRYLGMLGGIVFFSHQVGSFLGVWLGGYLFDLYGTYTPVWWIGAGLGIFAAIVHWPIQQAAVEREQPAAA